MNKNKIKECYENTLDNLENKEYPDYYLPSDIIEEEYGISFSDELLEEYYESKM